MTFRGNIKHNIFHAASLPTKFSTNWVFSVFHWELSFTSWNWKCHGAPYKPYLVYWSQERQSPCSSINRHAYYYAKDSLPLRRLTLIHSSMIAYYAVRQQFVCEVAWDPNGGASQHAAHSLFLLRLSHSPLICTQFPSSHNDGLQQSKQVHPCSPSYLFQQNMPPCHRGRPCRTP